MNRLEAGTAGRLRWTAEVRLDLDSPISMQLTDFKQLAY